MTTVESPGPALIPGQQYPVLLPPGAAANIDPLTTPCTVQQLRNWVEHTLNSQTPGYVPGDVTTTATGITIT